MGQSTPASPRDAEAFPTLRDLPDLGRVGKSRTVRRVFVGLLFVFLALGAAGLFGTRTSTVSASGHGYDLSVTYPAVTRPGLAIRYVVTVRHKGGFAGPITVSTTSDYLDLFDENGFDPEPAEITTTADQTIWTFDTFQGDVLTISFDARTEPARESGGSATTTLLVDGRPLATVSYRTWVMP